jgi:hypothetical protein
MKTTLLRILAVCGCLLANTACNLAQPVEPDLVATITAQALIIAGQVEVTSAPTSEPSLTPSETTSSAPMVTVSIDTNCRTGPGGNYEQIGNLMVGESAVVVGIYNNGTFWVIENPEAPGTCWLWGQYATVTGDTSDLSEIIPPPEPTWTTVAGPGNGSNPNSPFNLVAGNLVLSTATPTCGVSFTVGIAVTNNGTQATGTPATVSLVDTSTNSGVQLGTSLGGFPSLMPGQTFTVNMPLTINTYVAQHSIVVVVDSGHTISESNEGDNQASVNYTMQQGGCPSH